MLIALSLIAILLTFLFSFFVESAKIEKKLDTARMVLANRGYLQMRLQSILTSLDQASATSYFYTEQSEKGKMVSLRVIFDNGIDPEPAFSGSVLGKIYLDPQENLSLDLWPQSETEDSPWRKEVLLSHVERFEFEFLGPLRASDSGKKELLRPINANDCWRPLWLKSLRPTPGIIRLTVYETGIKEPIHYAFTLPVIEPLVTYPERAI